MCKIIICIGWCRWVNCLDPSLNKAEWTEEEDLKLEEAIAKHGYCWSKIAACIPHRTDNQCWRYVSLTAEVSLVSYSLLYVSMDV